MVTVFAVSAELLVAAYPVLHQHLESLMHYTQFE